MRYKIEYLTDTGDETSVCLVLAEVSDTPRAAEELAWKMALSAWGRHGADGFQVRDLERSEIILVEPFDQFPKRPKG
jgi:hypothetical protein